MPKIRIKLRGFDHKTLDASAQKIVEAARRSGAQVSGPIPLPTRVRRFTVIRGPFKHRTPGSTLSCAPTTGLWTSSTPTGRPLSSS